MPDRPLPSNEAPATRPSLLAGGCARIGLTRPELRAWALYDWANSAMVTTIVASVFPVYFSRVAAADLPPTLATRHFATASVVALAIVAFVTPPLSTWADRLPLKKLMLGLFLALGCAATAAMFFVQRGDWRLALVLFVLAEVGASGSFVFYDSLLPHIARQDEIDRVSATSYALGYLGGGLLLSLNLACILWPAAFGLPSGPDLTPAQATLPVRLAFLSVSVWWSVFSLPLFFHVKEPPVEPPHEHARRGTVSATWNQLLELARLLKQYPQALVMLIAFLFYNDGISTIIKMAAIYATELDIGQEAVIGSILLVQFLGVPCTLLFGSLAGWIGTKSAIFTGLGIYVAIALVGLRMTTAAEFFLLAILVAVAQGGTQSLSRSLFASLIPASRSAEFFAFFALSEKFAGIAGPALFALIILWTGSSRLAVAGVLPFFLIGGVLLSRVRVDDGRARAQQIPPAPATPE